MFRFFSTNLNFITLSIFNSLLSYLYGIFTSFTLHLEQKTKISFQSCNIAATHSCFIDLFSTGFNSDSRYRICLFILIFCYFYPFLVSIYFYLYTSSVFIYIFNPSYIIFILAFISLSKLFLHLVHLYSLSFIFLYFLSIFPHILHF